MEYSMETRELAPKAYKRLLRAFTPAEAKTSVDKWIDSHRQDYSSSNKKLLIDGRFYKYDGNEVTKTLRLSIFRKLNTVIGKQMSKAEGKRWRNRQKMTDAVVQDYRRLMSANKLQKFYKNNESDCDGGGLCFEEAR
jgi:hypothetical protein